MAEEASGPTWLKLGGLLSGIAALLTAMVAAVALLVDIWPTEREPSEVKPQSPEASEVKPPPPPVPALNLVRYQADGCFYAVELLDNDGADRRVRFPFNLAASVSAAAIKPVTYAQGLEPDMTVFVPGARANPDAARHEFYKQAIVDYVLGSVAHVRFEQEEQCRVNRELLALPATEILVAKP